MVGSGFGEDAAYLARQGFGVIGFDISPAAVRAARRRFPSVPVDFRVADLLNPPGEWRQHFDLVVESYTVQALPVRLRQPAVTHETRFVKPGGTLLVLAAARDSTEQEVPGPPWPLTRSDIESFATEGLVAVEIEELREPPDVHRWRAEFRRPTHDPASGESGEERRGRRAVRVAQNSPSSPSQRLRSAPHGRQDRDHFRHL